MIAACPTCSTRYRVDNERLRGEGLRLRCTRCQTVFRVRPPAAAETAPPAAEERVVEASHTGVSAASAPRAPEPPAPVVAAPPPAPPPAPTPPSVAPAVPAGPDPWVQAETTPAPRPPDRTRLVLIADSDVDGAKELAAALAGWGLEAVLAHDGVEAILAIQRSLPAAVVLDAALPKMFGFQVCELMKRNAELRTVKVVLVGAIHHRDRYRRPPQEIYGADAYLERPDLPHGIANVLRDFGLPIVRPQPAPPARPSFAGDPAPVAAPAPIAPAPPIVEAPRPVAAPAPQAAAPVAADDGLGEERAKAERLARIIVSDVILYNEEKFARAIAKGNVLESMDADLEEGRALFRQRIDARVREGRDFLTDELMRVARQRGMR
jgi:predicted Zn finger-like uncharacterized protein